MKLRLRYLAVVGLILPVLVVSPLTLAHDDSDSSTSSSQTLQERIKEHEAKFKVKLSELQEKRLKLRCVAAQGVIKVVSGRVDLGYPLRVKAYEEIQNHLASLTPKLKQSGIDTSKLEKEQDKLTALADTLKADFTTYKQSLSDLKDMKCSDDPAGFKAALEAARAGHQQVIKDAAAVRNYIKNTIKPTLQDIRTQLKAKEANT